LARRKTALAVDIATSRGKPPLQIRLGLFSLTLSLILLVVLAGLASVTIYNLIDGQTGQRRIGDNMSRTSSSSLREQEQEKLIKLGEERLLELQRENAARRKDLDDLEQRVQELTNSIKTQLAKDIEQRLPGGAPAPQPTPGSGGRQNPAMGSGGGTALPGSYEPLDPRQGSTYTSQFNRIMSDLNSVRGTISDNKLNISSLDIQVQSYRATLTQQKDFLDSEAGKRALAASDGTNPPRTLPVPGAITSPFGMRWSPFVAGVRHMHYGVDIGCREGTPVAATKDGVVTFVGYDSGYGNRIEVAHAGGWLTLYAHNNRILAKVGQVVKKGDIIALSGNTGASTGPHMHYELHQNGVAIDPIKLLAVPPTDYRD
jgi:murein DD-endopeptidase MepM/ murein hydrolase activator NlpD